MRVRGGDVLREARLRLLDLLLQIACAAAELLGLLVRNTVRATFDRIACFDLIEVFLPLGSFDEFAH
ncbi:hypothetical protein WJ28_12015 [Burkholderia thailandensis]|nr:hypothetical protein WJ27_04090 [Burkholderia thailandensis]KVG08371.1 hypothetical protein WJ25_15190 [Burkholderia thailandensis]KVG16836.1 hypothetical protein WJ28_12015 [Burkholderia thailandensis]ONC22639.1 hypothetical protein AQ913_12020 [Burkholderia pseudomallei]PJO69003.1 hypothetical protein CWD92_29085 [Burkholderia thailandensis]